MAKYYAVKVGANPGIYGTWPECEKQVKGFKGAKYKSFSTLDEAKEFIASSDTNGDEIKMFSVDTDSKPTKASDALKETKSSNKKEITLYDLRAAFLTDGVDFPKAYVDGSYVDGTFSYGVIFLNDPQADFVTFAGVSDDEELAVHRNVSGECLAAMTALSYAKSIGLKDISICYDYKGVGLWPLKQWKANTDHTREYVEFCDMIAEDVNIHFVKVDAHDNDVANEAVDGLAKYEVSLPHKQVRYHALSRQLSEMKTDYKCGVWPQR